MNSSIYSADRPTHLRIVMVATIMSLAIFGILLSVPVEHTSAVVNAGRPYNAGALVKDAATTIPWTHRI